MKRPIEWHSLVISSEPTRVRHACMPQLYKGNRLETLCGEHGVPHTEPFYNDFTHNLYYPSTFPECKKCLKEIARVLVESAPETLKLARENWKKIKGASNGKA